MLLHISGDVKGTGTAEATHCNRKPASCRALRISPSSSTAKGLITTHVLQPACAWRHSCTALRFMTGRPLAQHRQTGCRTRHMLLQYGLLCPAWGFEFAQQARACMMTAVGGGGGSLNVHNWNPLTAPVCQTARASRAALSLHTKRVHVHIGPLAVSVLKGREGSCSPLLLLLKVAFGEGVCIVQDFQLAAIHHNSVPRPQLLGRQGLVSGLLQKGAPCFNIILHSQADVKQRVKASAAMYICFAGRANTARHQLHLAGHCQEGKPLKVKDRSICMQANLQAVRGYSCRATPVEQYISSHHLDLSAARLVQ